MDNNSLKELLLNNSKGLERLLEILEKDLKRKKKKNFFYILGPIASILAVVIGGIFTGVYQKYQAENQKYLQEQQNRILEIQVVEKFLPHLSSGNDATQKSAIIALGELGNPELATKIAALYNSTGTRQGADALMSYSTQANNTQTVPIISEKLNTSKTEERWIYLGEYSANENRWIKRYLDFDDQTIPNTLVNKTLKVRRETGSLNVRKSILGEVIGGLKPESTIKILEVRNFAGIGYMWARVTR
jgi:hypothetical protein